MIFTGDGIELDSESDAIIPLLLNIKSNAGNRSLSLAIALLLSLHFSANCIRESEAKKDAHGNPAKHNTNPIVLNLIIFFFCTLKIGMLTS